MALAEPRRRQKWTLNPRGNLWANEEDKFGKKLMEKMGWEQGKGLGMKQDGMLDPVKLRFKDNSKGVGFEGQDDTWLVHQDDFQSVLEALNAEHGQNAGDKKGDESSKSLEASSKKSRARVHYQKFTRGKDLVNYSADDLGCILGTKSEKLQKKNKEVSSDDEENETAVGTEEKSHGLVTIQGGSIQDYFAKKMAELKARGKTTYTPSTDQPESDSAEDTFADKNRVEEDGGAEVTKKKKRKKAKAEETPVEPSEESCDGQKMKKKKTEETLIEPTEESCDDKKKKKKKRKKELKETSVEPSEDSSDSQKKTEEIFIDPSEGSCDGEKKKKRKKEMKETPVDPSEDSCDGQKKKKKKKREQEQDVEKNLVELQTAVPTAEEMPNADTKRKKDKKKKKSKAEEAAAEVLEAGQANTAAVEKWKKQAEAEEVVEEPEKMKKKKNKKGKKERRSSEPKEAEEEDSGCDQQADDHKLQKKKKKSKKEKRKLEEVNDHHHDEEEGTRRSARKKQKLDAEEVKSGEVKSEEVKSEEVKSEEVKSEEKSIDLGLGFTGSNLLAIAGYGT